MKQNAYMEAAAKCDRLMKDSAGICISMQFSAGTPDSHRRSQREKTENLLAKAEALLIKNLPLHRAKSIVANLKQRLSKERASWRKWPKGVAVYSKGESLMIQKLPQTPKDLVVVARRFHTKPILQMLQDYKPFWLVTLKDDTCELFEVGPLSMRQRAGVPLGRDDLLAGKINKEVFESFAPYLFGRKMDLVVAGEADTSDAFRNWARSRFNIAATVMPTSDLEGKASRVVEIAHHFALERVERDHKSLLNLLLSRKKDGLVSTRAKEIGNWLANNCIEQLFLAYDTCLWGNVSDQGFVQETHRTQQDQTDGDVANELAQIAAHRGIEIHLLPLSEMPGRAKVAAIAKPTIHAEAQVIRPPSFFGWIVDGQNPRMPAAALRDQNWRKIRARAA